jgi:Uma2 family endonuclease
MRMPTSTIVPLEEYLHTSYEPECEWIDGVLKEKTMPDGYHGYFQNLLLMFFEKRQTEFRVRALPEVRILVSQSHYRVPDVLVIPANVPFLPTITVTPLICIEVLSPDDRQSDLMEKIEDYRQMGVPAIWVVDPRKRTLAMADANGIHQVDELTLQGTNVRLTATEIFAELDQLEAL